MREARRWILALALASLACGGEKSPVKEISSAGSHPLPVSLQTAAGKRDGYEITATFTFGDGGGTRLTMDLQLHVDPQPVLDGGHWSYEGPTGRAEGEVLPRSMRFTGGQSDGVSLGGVYLLREGDRDRFEVDVPLTNLQPPAFR